MIAKTITYEDLFGNKRTEEFYFHLNKTELMDWLLPKNGVTLDKIMENMAKKQDSKAMVDEVRELIVRSCGRPSADGRRFDKSPEAKADFLETDAFSTLHLELCSDADKCVEFIQGIIPKDMGNELDKYMKEHGGVQVPDNLKPFVQPE